MVVFSALYKIQKIYFVFLLFAGAFLAIGLAEVVFLAAGFFPFGDDAVAGFFDFAVGAFLAVVLLVSAFFFLGGDSVLSEAEADVGGGATGAIARCLAASRQFGKNNSILWREMELARRHRGQCAS